MSNVKITDLPSLTGALSDSLDVLPVVDVSGDATSKMTRAEFFLNVPAITTTGNVGIGTSSVTAIYGRTVQVGDGSGTSSLSLIGTGATTTGDVYLASTGSEASLIARASTPLIFGAGDAERMRIISSGNVGIGTTSPAARVHIVAGPLAEQLRIQNVTTDATTKYGVVGGGHYTNAEEPFSGMLLTSAASTNKVDIGGGVSTMNAATSIIFNTASNNTTLIGTERLRIESAGQIGIGGANYGTSGQTIISAGSGAAPAWGTLPAVGGGTGITSYAIGDLVYASTTTALSKLADVATGNALISGGVGVAPAYGKIGLTTHVSGTLPVANGGTGVTTSTGSGAVVLGTGPTITGAALNGTLGATTASTVAATTVTATTSVLSSGSGGIGYSTGAGVAVTQLTSRTTAAPTTGAKTTGAVTLFTTTAVVGTYFTFTVPNTAIAVTDTVVVTVRGATNTYVAFVSAIVAATSFNVTMASVAGTASDTPIVNFTIIKGVSA